MNWQDDVWAIHEKCFPEIRGARWVESKLLALGLAGEVGELVNLIVKRWTGELCEGYTMPDIVSGAYARQGGAVAEEIADVAIYLELLARSLGIDVDKAVANKIKILVARRGPKAVEAVAEVRRKAVSQYRSGSVHLKDETSTWITISREYYNQLKDAAAGAGAPSAPGEVSATNCMATVELMDAAVAVVEAHRDEVCGYGGGTLAAVEHYDRVRRGQREARDAVIVPEAGDVA